MRYVNVLNINISQITQDEVLQNLTKGVVVTPNVDHLMKLQSDKEFYECYSKADWVLCDSKIVGICSRFLGTPIVEVIPGSSFLPAFYSYHSDNERIKIFLLGAGPGVAKQAMDNINKKTNRKIVIDSYSPTFGFEKNEEECLEIIQLINRSEANVLVVGVGAPKQEKWIFRYKDKLPGVDIFLALGATLDFEAGNIKRAPIFFQKTYLEWLYRLLMEPKRLWKRYLVDDLPFFWLILKQKIGLYKKPFTIYH